jgi:Zn-finger nucleic acid-binding protein
MRTYERNGVHVDQCGECRGIFLDRGELERLIDAENAWHGGTAPSAPSAPSAPAAEGRYRSDHDREEDRYRAQQRPAAAGGLGAVVSEVLGSVQGRSHSSSSRRPYEKKRKESFLGDLFG